jgi:DnaJ-class molecular chaperone
MENKTKKIACPLCQGTGQVFDWVDTIDEMPEFHVSDCDTCKGSGSIMVKIFDRRKLSKNKSIIHPGMM